MSFKNLFAHLDSSDDCAQRVSVAVQLAVQHEAHLSGMYQLPDINLSSYLTPDLGLTSLDKWISHMNANKAAVKDNFQATAKAHSVSAEWIETDSHLSASLSRRAHYADLLVAGQSSIKPRGDHGPSLESFVLETGRPVLAVPTIGPRPTLGSDILIAWDETKESARAVHDALPLLVKARKVCVLSIANHAQDASSASALAATLCHHLARHGVTAEAYHHVETSMSIAESLLSRAADLGSDLIVMGAYGHSRMRELVLGGTTRSILAHMTVPVLFSH